MADEPVILESTDHPNIETQDGTAKGPAEKIGEEAHPSESSDARMLNALEKLRGAMQEDRLRGVEEIRQGLLHPESPEVVVERAFSDFYVDPDLLLKTPGAGVEYPQDFFLIPSIQIFEADQLPPTGISVIDTENWTSNLVGLFDGHVNHGGDLKIIEPSLDEAGLDDAQTDVTATHKAVAPR
ncbi:MAG: hypothetical protein KDI90_07420 [Alphaproteobacteria bacterium]|nr:hypothetical protein [Alphaproteobacteria bacterium]MCB9974964.1 hypothetical protein [Rhodospirillales bacterium]